MKTFLTFFVLALSLLGQTKVDPSTQLRTKAEGDPRVFVQTSDGKLVFVRIDPSTLALDPAVGSQPPVLRAIVPTAQLLSMYAPPTVGTPTQVWTLPRAPSMVLVFRNGVLMKEGSDYDRTVAQITFRAAVPILSGDDLVFYFQ